MDSLLANYAASDDEEEQHEEPPPQPLSNSSPHRSEFRKSYSLLSSLPLPKQSSKPNLPTDFSLNYNRQVDDADSISTAEFGGSSIKSSSLSLPRPRIDGDTDGELTKPIPMFSSLPQPNSQKPQQPKSKPSSSEPKRVVLIKPPMNSFSLKSVEDDDDDEDEDAEKRRRKASGSSVQTASVASFLSSIPAPKNSVTLGALPTSGSGRRSILETNVAVSASDNSDAVNYSSGMEQNVGNHGEQNDNAANYNLGDEQNAWNYANYDGYGDCQYNTNQNVVGEAPYDPSGEYGGYENYGGYGDYGQYGSEPSGSSAIATAENAVRIPEKRRRNEIPSEIVEVKQDELMKNRPKEHQVKLTGIALGPSYQPASTKGKPSKLHKRKHQINSLFFDMKQKEMELAERRSRGLLTKAETQAKYGW